MKYNFLNIFLDKKELPQQEKASINQLLIDNNSSQFEKLYDFYKSDVNLLCINGFLGTGKVQIVDYSLTFLSAEAIVLKYNCFNSTVLDDILLSLFSDFKKMSAQKVISEPKIKTENFSQKINSYFSSIEKPFVIVMDSFEAILKENRQEILDFIFHLLTLKKVKIILISRTFEISYFENSGIEYQRISTYALEKKLFEKYLKSEKIKFTGFVLDEFYKYTRGYFLYTLLSLKIMSISERSLSEFLDDFRASFLTFDEYIQKRAVELIPATSRNLFWFLSMVRHPVSLSLLKTLNMYDEEKINQLRENFVLNQDDSSIDKLIYVQDYFKEQVDISIAPNIAQKIRQYVVDLYQTQLPLKPLERNILISRQTMRKEIEYHNYFLPKHVRNLDHQEYDINYLTYSRGIEFDYGLTKSKDDENKPKDEKQKKASDSLTPVDITKARNININLNNLPFQLSKKEKNFLNSLEGKPEQSSTSPDADITDDTLSLNELLELAKLAEAGYHYSREIDLYRKALRLYDSINIELEPEHKAQLPIIYTKLAHSCRKIADYENALNYYELAKSLYEKSGEFVKANYIRLKMSKILYETYRLDKSKETLLEILKYESNPAILTTKTYLQLANLENNLSNADSAFSYYRHAVEVSNEMMDIETLSELYFKYALILDDKNESNSAIEFYEKCINLSEDYTINKFLSSSYSNIATLYLEKNNLTYAVKHYLKAYDIDEKNNNCDGMYFAASKLASVLQKKYPEEALKYFEKALECAKTLNDIFYIASASLAVGDFHYDKKQDELALKHYVSALELVKDDFSKDNIDKIKIRINDIRFRLGETAFEKIMSGLKVGGN